MARLSVQMEPCLILGLRGAGWNTGSSSTNRACRSEETFICFTLKSFLLAAGWGMDCDRTRVVAGDQQEDIATVSGDRRWCLRLREGRGIERNGH